MTKSVRLVGILAVSALLSGCLGGMSKTIPVAETNDCYRADRVVNASPSFGASAVLDGNLVKIGCVELIKAAVEAKKEGIDIDVNKLLGL